MTTTIRRSTRTRKAPQRYCDEKFIPGNIDYYQRSYDGMYEEGTIVAKLEDSELYYEGDSRRRNWIDYTESLMEFMRIWRGLGMTLPEPIVEKIGSYLNLPSFDKRIGVITNEITFIADDNEVDTSWCGTHHSCEEDELSDYETSASEESWYESDEDGIGCNRCYACVSGGGKPCQNDKSESDDESDAEFTDYCPGCESGCDADSAHRMGHQGTGYHPDCYMNADEEGIGCNRCYACVSGGGKPCQNEKKSSPKKPTFDISLNEIHETYSKKEYDRRNFGLYDAIRARDRADNNWRRMIKKSLLCE